MEYKQLYYQLVGKVADITEQLIQIQLEVEEEITNVSKEVCLKVVKFEQENNSLK